MVDDKSIIRYLKSTNQDDVNRYFKCAYDKYFRLVCYCIMQYVTIKEDVEEIADDTFISLYNNRESLDENKNLKYFIITIAKNKAISFIRRKDNDIIPLDESIDTPIEENIDNSEELLGKLRNVLSDEELFILSSHLIYGYSFIEIANMKNMSINTVTTKYRRLLKKASKELSKEDYE